MINKSRDTSFPENYIAMGRSKDLPIFLPHYRRAVYPVID
jgi:hypothetical protein